jgi:hypothetical protein
MSNGPPFGAETSVAADELRISGPTSGAQTAASSAIETIKRRTNPVAIFSRSVRTPDIRAPHPIPGHFRAKTNQPARTPFSKEPANNRADRSGY